MHIYSVLNITYSNMPCLNNSKMKLRLIESTHIDHKALNCSINKHKWHAENPKALLKTKKRSKIAEFIIAKALLFRILYLISLRLQGHKIYCQKYSYNT